MWKPNNYYAGHKIQWSRSGTLACQWLVFLRTGFVLFENEEHQCYRQCFLPGVKKALA